MNTKRKTDWNKCCLCQKDKKEDLKSPATRDRDGWIQPHRKKYLLFSAINALRIPLYPGRLDEGLGIEVTLGINNARYHQSCRLQFNNTKLQRAEMSKKRAAATDTGESTSCHESRAKRSKTVNMETSQCFSLYVLESDAPKGTLRQAMTMKLNEGLKQCAERLNDGNSMLYSVQVTFLHKS